MMLSALLLAAAVAEFDVNRFFGGQTVGNGELKIVFRSRQAVRVEGTGIVEADGTLVLDQKIVQGDQPARVRRWRLRQISPGKYQGTLTDARGMVNGTVDGPRLHLSFLSKEGFSVQQWLVLAEDGRSASNRLVAHRFGVTVASLRETIAKLK